jgi:hypothetical protein
MKVRLLAIAVFGTLHVPQAGRRSTNGFVYCPNSFKPCTETTARGGSFTYISARGQGQQRGTVPPTRCRESHRLGIQNKNVGE